LIDLVRRFTHIRGGPLSGRLTFGILSAVAGAIVFHAIGRFIDGCQAYAAFYLFVQIAGLTGGLAGAGAAGAASTLIMLFAGAPFADLWTGVLLLNASATLAGCAGESLRRASELARRESQPPAAEGPPGATRAGPSRTFESAAATIAHDITQPLAAAAAYLQTVRRLLSSETGVRGSSIAAPVEKAAAQLARAGRLVTGMNEFLAHGPPRLAIVPLHAVLLEAIGPIRSDDGPLLRLEARNDLVLVDPAQVEQLFVELLHAAVARAPEGRPSFGTRSDGVVVIVTIAISGLDSATPDGGASELSLWRATVEAQRGAFRVEPRAAGGLTIEFALPLAARGG
jgi:signal transduction histidine kinase